jgi:hypothetical protein
MFGWHVDAEVVAMVAAVAAPVLLANRLLPTGDESTHALTPRKRLAQNVLSYEAKGSLSREGNLVQPPHRSINHSGTFLAFANGTMPVSEARCNQLEEHW